MTQPCCRHCGAALSQTLVDLGLSPLANSYVPPERADMPCPRYPLHAWVCNRCYLVQVEDAVPADEIFNADYAYFSSYSVSWLAHARAYVEDMVQRFDLGPEDLVIEIASNDGYLLQYFVEKGIPVLGVEPSGSVAAAAQSKGVRTIVDYFGVELARKIAGSEKPPALICSANVLAHVPDINDFVAGIAFLLSGDAVYTVEFPHLLNLINEVQFDTIYHEHYSYLSLLAVEEILSKAGLRVFDVEELPTHGGSLRVFACLNAASHSEGAGLAKVRADEAAAQLDRPEGYMNFTGRVEALRDGLLAFLRQAKAKGETVAAYGAAAKGNTLLNYAGIGTDLIAYCVDRNPAKQNTLLPGSHIPVFGIEALREAPPDYVLILPWNIRDEVVKQMEDLRTHGTRFVTAVPEIRVN
ncbi:class I SAM-dependent methyltransferase [Ruegeria sediminis]|uniref:Class I SAM-dependent methyltransferase n=1 Tax=Ruegeria sediminis TaxID=2583820 RepID=A0ABY2WWA6_9RHOB|nr:class I SAM-dependent methyltransferase [Ruegeria sediminis]TMV07032.1 class I SAM-dependent methyltransferase [Ruegeria sediminis]